MQLDVDLQRACEADVPDEEQIHLWALKTLVSTNYSFDAEITVRIVDAETIQQLNSHYRHKDKATNVLSFPFEIPLGLSREDVGGLLGDLVICADIVDEEAALQGKSKQAHWAHMVIHGCLHLLGYDHIKEQEAIKMEALEIDLLSSLGYANPYAENS